MLYSTNASPNSCLCGNGKPSNADIVSEFSLFKPRNWSSGSAHFKMVSPALLQAKLIFASEQGEEGSLFVRVGEKQECK